MKDLKVGAISESNSHSKNSLYFFKVTTSGPKYDFWLLITVDTDGLTVYVALLHLAGNVLTGPSNLST